MLLDTDVDDKLLALGKVSRLGEPQQGGSLDVNSSASHLALYPVGGVHR